MCKVKDIEECEKKLFITLKNGEQYESPWFEDHERKNTYGEFRFTELEHAAYEALLVQHHIAEEDVARWSVNRNKSAEEDCVFISRHGFDRMRERNGWNKKTAMRMIKKVFDCGLSPNDVKGEYRPWVKQRAEKHPDSDMRFYGQNLYVFDNNVLITVLPGTKMYQREAVC